MIVSVLTGEVIARPAIEPHLRAVLASNDAEAFMQARRDEPARKSTLQHVGQIELGRGECNRAEPGESCYGRA